MMKDQLDLQNNHIMQNVSPETLNQMVTMSEQISQPNRLNPNVGTSDDPEDQQLEEVMRRIQNIRQNNQNRGFQLQFNMRNWNTEKSCLERILDFIFFWYLVYLFFTVGITDKLFAWVWLLSNCCGPIKPFINIVLLVCSIYIYFFSNPSSQITLFFYLHILDISCLCLGFCCCQVGIIALICLVIFSQFIKLKTKIKKYIRYQKNLSQIKEICAFKFNHAEFEETGVSCPICLMSEGDYCQTSCGHNFHSSCLKTWLQNSISCPVCRTKLY